MILLLDNYDSFVFNLGRYVEELGCETRVVRNDALSVREVESLRPQAIIISPGPCTPAEAGISIEVIRHLGSSIPILGVCLGHQAIAAALGGEVIRAPEPIHGRTSRIIHHEQNLFRGIPNPFRAMRYHSLIAHAESLPAELSIVARTTDGIPMAIEHRSWPLFGVQFHPESILTENGHQLLANFLRIAGIAPSQMPSLEFAADLAEPDWHSTPIEDLSCRPL